MGDSLVIDVKVFVSVLLAALVLGGGYIGYQAYVDNSDREKCLNDRRLDANMGEHKPFSDAGKRAKQKQLDRCADLGVY